MLRALFPPRASEVESRNINATPWGSWGDDVVGGGVTVNQDSALRLLAVVGSVQLITETIATLPVDVYRKTSDGRVSVTAPRWLVRPTPDLSFTDWCTQVLTSLLLHGNAYLAVYRSGVSIVDVAPVDPSLVTVRRDGGRKVYVVNGAPYQGEMLHIKGMMLPGSDVGLSPLEYARQSISLGLEAVTFGNDQFANGNNMPGVIEVPGQMDPTSMADMARAWKRARSKRNRGMPGVLEGGATWKATGVTNEQAQFLQTRQWTAAEIAAQVYLVDPREIGIPLTGSTIEYQNAESRMANLVRKGLLRWITRLEWALSSLLPSPQYVKFNVDAFLRGDSGERWTQYHVAAQINEIAARIGMKPVLTTDEMRELEDRNPIEDEPMADEPGEEVPS